jgi:non-canonical purine NTP pyrophosphatase (RdgB/HAM1 family)
MNIERMVKIMDLLMATGNQYKLLHWSNLFQEYFAGFEVLGPRDMGLNHIKVEERDDDKATYLDNALLKAKAYYDKYNIPVLADDSGLEITKLNGWPGINTARVIKDNYNAYLDALKDYPDFIDRAASYHTAVVYIDEWGHIYWSNTVRHGWIAKVPMGDDNVANCVEKCFIPYTSFARPDELPDDSEKPPFTLGVMNSMRKYGQHYQITLAYPVSELPPSATLLDTIIFLQDSTIMELSRETKNTLREDFRKLPTDIKYEYRVPELPQSLAERMHMSVF